MAELIFSGAVLTSKSHFPCTYTLFVLGVLGAIPFSFSKPHLPNRKWRESTFLYCVLFYGLTVWTSIDTATYLYECMESAYPYNHIRYIVAFELIVSQLMNIATPVSWIDTHELLTIMDAWCQFIGKYEKVFKKPIPNCKLKEVLVQILIVVATPLTYASGASMIESELQWQWKCVTSIVFPSLIIHSFVLQWLGYCWTIEKVAKQLAKHLNEVGTEKHLLTHKLLEEYRALWILLRNITDKISNMKIAPCVCLLDCIFSTMSIFEGGLLYSKTKNVHLAMFNLSICAFTLVPLILVCHAGHNATDRVQHLFEELTASLDVSSLSKAAQREICMIYLVKRKKKPVITFTGFSELNLPLLLSVVSSISMYIMILIQFHQVM